MRAISLTAIFVLGSVTALADPAVVALRENVYVKGPTVTLGDVATIDGEDAEYLASIELTSAALPGATRRLNSAVIYSRLEQAGVFPEEVDLRGANLVSATTIHLELTREMIGGDLRDFIQDEMPWDADQATIDVYPPSQGLVVSDGHVEFRWRTNPGYDFLGNGSFRGEVLVNGEVEQSFYAKASIEAFADVVVATRDISRGERLTSANIGLDKRALSSVGRSAYFDADQLSGLVAKATMIRGQVVTDRKVEAPILVKRNQIVTVETKLGALTVQAQAKALGSAAAGDMLVVESPSTKREMSGVVRPDGTVVVE